MFSASALAQNQTVSGTVLDELGEPVIGATVTVEGEKTATITDMDGNYKIAVPKGKKITISYIGYMPMTVAPGGTVKLEEDKQTLEEVVVVGYGSQKKAHLTGSIATVEMDDIQDLANGNLGSSLSGLVNGLSVTGGDSRPGEPARLAIRDVNSLGEIGSTAQQPLFVIDGYIYPNDVKVGNSYQNLGAEAFNNLDPSEVESISDITPRKQTGQTDSVWTLTIRAEKTDSPRTKGLAIDGTDESSTTVLKSAWLNEEKVYVYLSDTQIGTLAVKVDETDFHQATLSGTVTTADITPGSTRLTLLTPYTRDQWTYVGQAGLLLVIVKNCFSISLKPPFFTTLPVAVKSQPVADKVTVVTSYSYFGAVAVKSLAQMIYKSFVELSSSADKSAVFIFAVGMMA